MAGLYDDTPGLSDGTGLWRGRLGLFSGASGFINGGGGAAYIDLYFSAGTYSVSGSNYTALGSIPGFTFTRASLAMGYDATGKLTYGPNNLCLQSQTFDNASWVGSNRTVTANTSVAPDGTTTADTVAGTGAGGTLLRQDVAVPGVATVVVSFYVKADTATTCAISDVNYGALGVFNLSTGAVISGSGASIFSAGNGWYRCVVSYNPIAGFARVAINPGSTFNPTTTSAILVWGAQYEAVTYQTTPSTYYPTTTAAYYGPRLVYDPVTLASQGILVEEARTNLCLQSSDLTNASWVALAATTAKTATGPDGAANSATTVTATSANAYVKQLITSASAARTTSTYIKRRTGSGTVTLSHGDTTGADVVVNGDFASDTVWTKGTGWTIGAGAATFVGGTPDYLKQLGIVTVGKIYKVTFTVTAITGAASLSTYIGDSPSLGLVSALGTYSYIGMAASTALGLAFRGNSSSGATSISIDNVSMLEVVQTTATVTADWTRVATPTATITDPIVGIRLATSGDAVDIAYVQNEAGTGASSPIPTTTASVTRAADAASLTGISVPAPYSVAAEFIIPRAIPSIDITNWGTPANGGGMYTTPNGQAWVRESSVTTANVFGGALSANVAQKMAARYAVNDVNASVNGGIGTADTSVTPPSMSNIGLGPALFSFGGIYPNGTISRIRIFNRALSDAQLQSLTT